MNKSKVWQKINALLGQIKSGSRSKDTQKNSLWITRTVLPHLLYSNLPHGVRVGLDEHKFDRAMKIEIACAKTLDANTFIDYSIKQN